MWESEGGMDPLISVIVPVRNGQKYIVKCIESIERQSYDNLEIIVVDDGSTDDTPILCQEILKQYQLGERKTIMGERSFVLITQDGCGVSEARNAALDICKGEYVSFVDSDDMILPEMIKVLYRQMVTNQCDISGCRFFIWENDRAYDQKKTSYQRDFAKVTIYQANEYISKQVLKGNCSVCTKLFRKDKIGDLRFKKRLTIGEDMLFLLEMQSRVQKLVEVSYPGYAYYHNVESVMKRKFEKTTMDQITCWELARDYIGAGSEVDTKILISIMLVVGKISELPFKRQRELKQEIKICEEKIKMYNQRSTFQLLDRDYKLKVAFFEYCPKLYMLLYHIRKMEWNRW